MGNQNATLGSEPIDVISARITQARGVLSAISAPYNTDTKEHELTPQALNAALWGLEELLDQLEAAFTQMTGEVR